MDRRTMDRQVGRKPRVSTQKLLLLLLLLWLAACFLPAQGTLGPCPGEAAVLPRLLGPLRWVQTEAPLQGAD